MNDNRVRKYTPDDRSKLSRFIEEMPKKVSGWHKRWPSDRTDALFRSRLDSILEKESSNVWLDVRRGEVVGMLVLAHLPWDSNQLNLSAARIEYLLGIGDTNDQRISKNILIENAIAFSREQHISHISIRVDSSDLTGLHALEKSGFITVDGILTFGRIAVEAKAGLQGDTFQIRMARPTDVDDAAGLAKVIYTLDRFHADPAVSQELADQLYAQWVRNSILGQAADAVLIAEDKHGTAGFITCKIQSDTKEHLGELVGSIVLVATAKRARDMGLGKQLTFRALDWFYKNSVEVVEVGTQFRNIPASRLYQSCGFKLIRTSTSLRKLI